MPEHHALQCMEIWGGSAAASAQSVNTPGLHATVLSRPFEGAAEGGDIHYVTVCGGGIITRAILADVPYGQVAVRCQTGDAVILYTDYLVEARNPAGEALGEEGVLRLAADLPVTDPEAAARELLASVDAFRGPTPPDDDASVLVL